MQEMHQMASMTDENGGELPKGYARSADSDNSLPEDAPLDCEWRHLETGFFWLDPHKWNTEKYAELANKTLRGRSFLMTSKAYVGIGPDDMQKNDAIVILYGACTPFILRQVEGSSQWRLVGDCYIHGVMSREALSTDRGADQKFVLV